MDKLPENEISIVWHIEDVKDVAPELTKAEAREVLQRAKFNHDANIGINWDLLGYLAEEVRHG